MNSCQSLTKNFNFTIKRLLSIRMNTQFKFINFLNFKNFTNFKNFKNYSFINFANFKFFMCTFNKNDVYFIK